MLVAPKRERIKLENRNTSDCRGKNKEKLKDESGTHTLEIHMDDL